VVQIVGTQFKGVQSVFFGAQTVTPLSVSPTGDTITVEVPQPSTGGEKENVTISVSIPNPNKPTETLHSNVKGKFKYAEMVVEEFAGNKEDTTGYSRIWVNADRKQVRFYKPRKIVTDNAGDLYLMADYYILKIDIKTGLVNTIANEQMFSTLRYFNDMTIAPDNTLYLIAFMNNGNTNYSAIQKYSPVSKTFKTIYSTLDAWLDVIEFFNNEIYYVDRSKTTTRRTLKRVNDNTELIDFNQKQPYSIKFIDKNVLLATMAENIYQYDNFSNPHPLLEKTVRGYKYNKITVDKNNNLHCVSDNEWVIKPLYKQDKKAIYKTLPTDGAWQVVPDNLGNYYVPDLYNNRILKISLK
jgi:hypothetical protein